MALPAGHDALVASKKPEKKDLFKSVRRFTATKTKNYKNRQPSFFPFNLYTFSNVSSCITYNNPDPFKKETTHAVGR